MKTQNIKSRTLQDPPIQKLFPTTLRSWLLTVGLLLIQSSIAFTASINAELNTESEALLSTRPTMDLSDFSIEGHRELYYTLQQIKQSLRLSQRIPLKNFCIAQAEDNDSDLYDDLAKLNTEQVHFCQSFIAEQSSQLLNLIEKPTTLAWAEDSQNTKRRVTDRSEIFQKDNSATVARRTIFIHKNYFLKLKNYQRVTLLTHELLLLTNYQKNPLQDQSPLGPYEDKNAGTEQLLNAVSATLFLESTRDGITEKALNSMKAPTSTARYWIWLGGTNMTSMEPRNNLLSDDYKGSEFGFRYQPSWYGFNVELSTIRAEKKYLSSIQSKETQARGSMGLSLRYRPFESGPSEYWSQFYLLADLNLEFLGTKLEISDTQNNESNSTSSVSLVPQFEIYLPLFNKFWLYGSTKVSFHNYSYKISGEEYIFSKPQYFTSIGVAYGF